MQAKAKQIVITTESHEFLVVRRVRRGAMIHCPNCGEQWAADDLDPVVQYDRSTGDRETFIDDRRLADGLKKVE